ncbi:sensor histidine kinase [Cellulophaga fucicola]|uniref:histidine kinase n=1 Tax=Cellulophaga fucicola TaxID=76595 RepID=A0A1K1Q8L1_9FLAO|nr:ATP-binding protein [Cellulophaga fucicola]SFW56280.1 Signal transduction histidine kinase [Cellulophaga fucicola]
MIQKWWKSYLQWYLDYTNLTQEKEQTSIAYFRSILFISILLLVTLIGVIAYIPTVIVGFINENWIVVFTDTFAIGVVLFVTFFKPLTLSAKKNIFSANLLLLSSVLFINHELSGNGPVLLFMTTSIITLYSGRKAGLYSFFIAMLIYTLILLSYYFNVIELVYTVNYHFTEFIIIALNNLLFNLVIIFSISFLINQLHRAFIKETKLQQELIVKHNDAVSAKIRAEKSEQLKTAFLTNLSHEVGTPMYGILGTTDFLKEYNKDDKEYQDYIKLIENNGTRLINLIASIVNISKVETGLMQVNASTFNISDVIDEVYATLAPAAKEKGIVFAKNNLINANEAIIHSDSEKLKEVLKQLLENAIKYTEKGSIDFRCFYSDENTIEFLIKDTGIGIPQDKFESIFNAFYQVDTEHKNALHGSGIGLAIAKAYTQMLGGKLSLENNWELGTTFRFTIDIHLQKKAEGSSAYKNTSA